MTAPKERIAAAVEAAEQELDAAYWAACDEARAAVDPADLTSATWAQEFLADPVQPVATRAAFWVQFSSAVKIRIEHPI